MTDQNDDLPHGPLRRAPRYYVGETIGGRLRPLGKRGAQHSQPKYGGMRVTYPDTERYKNGALPGIRDKHARRIIRKAFLDRESKITEGLRAARAMQAQAREIVGDEHYDRSRYAQSKLAEKLYQKELAIHTPVYAPTKRELRRMRTEARKAQRAGMKKHARPIDNAIDSVVDKYGIKP